MIHRNLNTLLILAITLAVAGFGYYQTEVRQPEALQQIEETKKLIRVQEAELEQLFVEEAATAEQANEVMRKWYARYKYIPANLRTSDVVQYLESLSQYGFEQFQIKLGSQGSEAAFRYYLFDVSGTASYQSLYQFVWHLENNHAFYQVTNLDLAHQNVFKKNEETGLQRRLDMVSFSMKLKVFYDGMEGLSAPTKEITVPETLLPARMPPHNSFYPLVRTDLPPNDELLVDTEVATLVSIVGARALFQDKNGQHVVEVGDPVYLGEVVAIDPANAKVRVRLNKGGNEEILELDLGIEPAYELSKRPDLQLVPNMTDPSDGTNR